MTSLGEEVGEVFGFRCVEFEMRSKWGSPDRRTESRERLIGIPTALAGDLRSGNSHAVQSWPFIYSVTMF